MMHASSPAVGRDRRSEAHPSDLPPPRARGRWDPRAVARALALTMAAVFAAGLGCSSGCANRTDARDGTSGTIPTPPQKTRVVDVFAFGRLLGTVAPCGCTSDPLGGLDHAFGMIEARSKDAHRLIVEPGSFLFPDPQGPEAPRDEAAWAQAVQRADLLHRRFGQLGHALVAGVGATDFASPQRGAALQRWPLPRAIGNLSQTSADGEPQVSPTTTVRLGDGLEAVATTLVDPGSIPVDAGFPPLRDPVAAAQQLQLAEHALRVASVQGPRSLAEAIARTGRFHLVVMGGPLTDAQRGRVGSNAVLVGKTWLVEPGDRAQTISHVRLAISTSGFGEAQNWSVTPPRSTLERQKAHIAARLNKFADDPSADRAFLARLKAELATVERQLSGGGSQPEGENASVTFEQVKVRCSLPADRDAEQGLETYNAWIAQTNKARFAGVRPPEPTPGTARYVGGEACSSCHAEAHEFWVDTRHAGAFATLERGNKQYDVDCVGCHVTGFRQPGGSEVVENEGLRDVQCEQCHGPGSLHVSLPIDPASERPLHIARHAPVEVCLTCHTPEHSDTFDYPAYLRDVLGPGHGARARETLGTGPTGRQLRAAAIEKAGGSCAKQ
ncbi:MAG: hypothetical protein B7733_23470 [Myxococcales bacterium FL481]|nr:MAG: hypothetical protein B7733_23470 [Myxococcales bacterium FL481]